VSLIGQGLALARGLQTKHAVKQVDRLLSNPGIDVDALLPHWVRHVIGQRPAITVAMDWTEFAADGQATLMLSLLCRHGRATPLFWLSVETATLKDRRNGYEYQALVRLAEALPVGIKVCLVADRGFGDRKLYRLLTEELKFDFAIRFRGNITVTAADGEARHAADWLGKGGRAVRTSGPNPARCHRHRRRLPRPRRPLRAGQGHEGLQALPATGAWPAAPTCHPPTSSSSTPGAGASSAGSEMPRIRASAWAWARSTSAPRPAATASG
jgi:hypothetical protein